MLPTYQSTRQSERTKSGQKCSIKEEDSSTDQQLPANYPELSSSFLINTEGSTGSQQESYSSFSFSDQSGDSLFCSEEVGCLEDSENETAQVQNGNSSSTSPPAQDENAVLMEEGFSFFPPLSSPPSSPSYSNQLQPPSTPNTVFFSPNPQWFTSPPSSSYYPPFQLQTPPLHHLPWSPLNSPSPPCMQSLIYPSLFEPAMPGQKELHF